MFRAVIAVCGGILMSVAVFVLYIWPHFGSAPPDATRSLVLAIAGHIFNESRFPVLVRRDNILAECNPSGEEGGVVLLTRPNQQPVTEFVYNSGVVCVHTYLSRQQAPVGQKPAVLNSGRYEATFGELPVRAYYADRDIAFKFPESRDEDIVAGAVGEFFQKIPRYFNAQTEGGLSKIVGEFTSPQTAARAFVQQVAAAQPKDKFALNVPGGWFAILAVGMLSLAIAAVQPMWKRFHPATSIRASFSLPAVPPTSSMEVPRSPASTETEPAALNQRVVEREEKAIRMIPLLKETITQEAGANAANLIFAEGAEIIKKALRRGVSPNSAERIFLAGKLAALLEKKHARRSDRMADHQESG